MTILLGIDKFMSECQALTNFIGNGVATIVIARSEGELDRGKLAAALDAGRGVEEMAADGSKPALGP
jgi:aerobic C4-dicarboxylate transport protein